MNGPAFLQCTRGLSGDTNESELTDLKLAIETEVFKKRESTMSGKSYYTCFSFKQNKK